MVQSSMSRTMAFGVGGFALVVLVAALTWTVANQIDRAQADYEWVPAMGLVMVVVSTLSIGLIVGGFRIMRRAPSLGAFLVVVASTAFAATLFWLIIPPLAAIALDSSHAPDCGLPAPRPETPLARRAWVSRLKG